MVIESMACYPFSRTKSVLKVLVDLLCFKIIKYLKSVYAKKHHTSLGSDKWEWRFFNLLQSHSTEPCGGRIEFLGKLGLISWLLLKFLRSTMLLCNIFCFFFQIFYGSVPEKKQIFEFFSLCDLWVILYNATPLNVSANCFCRFNVSKWM